MGQGGDPACPQEGLVTGSGREEGEELNRRWINKLLVLIAQWEQVVRLIIYIAENGNFEVCAWPCHRYTRAASVSLRHMGKAGSWQKAIFQNTEGWLDFPPCQLSPSTSVVGADILPISEMTKLNNREAHYFAHVRSYPRRRNVSGSV